MATFAARNDNYKDLESHIGAPRRGDGNDFVTYLFIEEDGTIYATELVEYNTFQSRDLAVFSRKGVHSMAPATQVLRDSEDLLQRILVGWDWDYNDNYVPKHTISDDAVDALEALRERIEEVLLTYVDPQEWVENSGDYDGVRDLANAVREGSQEDLDEMVESWVDFAREEWGFIFEYDDVVRVAKDLAEGWEGSWYGDED